MAHRPIGIKKLSYKHRCKHVSHPCFNTFYWSLTKVYTHSCDALSTNRNSETVWGIYGWRTTILLYVCSCGWDSPILLIINLKTTFVHLHVSSNQNFNPHFWLVISWHQQCEFIHQTVSVYHTQYKPLRNSEVAYTALFNLCILRSLLKTVCVLHCM